MSKRIGPSYLGVLKWRQSVAKHRENKILVDRIVKNRELARLVASGLWPNAKEVSESLVGLDMLLAYSPVKKNDPSGIVLVAGDGKNPMTGVLIARHTSWEVHSCDPKLKENGKWGVVERLVQHRRKAEDLKLPRYNNLMVLAIHSHAPLRDVLATCRKYGKREPVITVSMPCCVSDMLGTPDKVINVSECLSPKNTVNIYKPKR